MLGTIRAIPFFAIVFLNIAATTGADATIKIGRFERCEVALTAQDKYTNPYSEVSAEATLNPPGSAPSKTIPLFWDSANTWKLRFSPDTPGTWRF